MSNTSKARDEAGVIRPEDLTPDQERALEQIAEHVARLAKAKGPRMAKSIQSGSRNGSRGIDRIAPV